MIEEIKEIFSGMLRKSPVNLFYGLGLAMFSILFFDSQDIMTNKGSYNNMFYAILDKNPACFWLSFFVGFIWSNSMIKELQVFTF